MLNIVLRKMHRFIQEHNEEGNARMLFNILGEEIDEYVPENYIKEQYEDREID
jgi:hypothetical protein